MDQVYDGFISYSHAADDLLAPRLQAALQKFAKPWWKRRAVRIFRDESSLSANPHLWSSITEALDTSGWLVLLLSPDAAQSEWVNQEIAYWVEHRDPSRILPVVTDGQFGWAEGQVSGNSAPDELRGVFSEEPRWVDLRGIDAETELDLKNPEFGAAVADIAATIRGIPKDELASEEVRQHRRTVRTAGAAGAALVFLAVASTFFAVRAIQNADAAEAAREAETTNRIASQAPIVFQTDAQLGLLLAVEAYNRQSGPVTLGALQRVLVGSRSSLGYVGKDVDYRDLAWLNDEQFLASHNLGIDLINVDGSSKNLGFSEGAWLVELSPNRTVAAVSTPNSVSLVDARTGDPTGVELPHAQVRSIAFSPDGTVIATGDLHGLVYFWEVASGRQQGEPVEAHPESTFEEFGLVTENVEGIVAHQTDTFRIGAVELSFSSDGRRLVTAGMVVARAWDIDTRAMLDEVRLGRLGTGSNQPTSALELRQGTSGEPVTIATNGQLLEWTPGSGGSLELLRSFSGVSGAGMTLALTDAAITGRVVLFAPDGGRLVGADLREEGNEWVLDSLFGGQAHIAVSPSGDRVAHAGDGGVAIWSLKGDGPISVSVPNVQGDEVIASTDGHVVVNSFGQPSRLYRFGTSGLVEASADEFTPWEWIWVIDDKFLGQEKLGRLDGPWRLDSETFEPLFQVELSEGNSVYAIDGLATGVTVIGGISNRVDVSGPNGSMLAVLEGLGAPVGSVDVSPDGKRVVAADVLGAALVWDLPTQSPIGSTPLSAGGGQVVVVEYHPSGRYLVTISQEGRITLRDPETLQPTATLEGIGGIAAGGASFGPFFQPNSRYMVTTADGLGRLWDLEELVQVGGTFPNEPGTLAQASSDGRWLVTVTDGDVVLWDLDTSLWGERACRTAGRNLTQDEWIEFIGGETPYRASCPMWEADSLEQKGES